MIRSFVRSMRLALMGAMVVLASVSTVATEATPASAAGVTVSGTGSSYAAIAINSWVSQIYTAVGTNVNYQSSSSVLGLENFAQGLVDFGASEIGYSAGQTQTNPPAGYQYLPDVAGATCLMYNVLGQTGQQVTELQLSPATIAGIFTGTIRKWNDPAIVAQNPGALLPNTAIVVTFRSDASGDNYIFSDYIQVTQPAIWAAFTSAMGVKNAPSAAWPTPSSGGNSAGQFNEGSWVSQSGSDNASNYVASSLNTITYVETGYATEHNMPCAYIQNASGNAVRPSELGDAIALTNDQIDLATGEQSLAPVFNAPQADAYPISAYSYLVTPTTNISPAKGAALSQFVLFLACQGQQSAGTLGYSPLPTNLVQADFNAIAKINGHVALPATIDANTCPNPYITGQLQSLGSPPPLNAATGAYTSVVTSGGGGAASGGSTGSASTAGTGGAAAVLHASRSKGGIIAAAGQTPGVALVAASGKLLGTPAPTGTILGWTAAFLAILVVPIIAFTVMSRRKTRVDAGGGEATGGEGDA